MVAGDVRFGAIASFICDDGRHPLAAYFQEVLKYMTNGQPVEVALEFLSRPDFPGQSANHLDGGGPGPIPAERQPAQVLYP